MSDGATAYYARNYVRETPNVTSSDMENASDRQTIFNTAMHWLKIARELERRSSAGCQAFDDLRTKL